MRTLLLLTLFTASLSYVGCSSTRYFNSSEWLTSEQAIEDNYFYGKQYGAPFRGDFYDSVTSRIASAPVDSLTAKQLVFIQAEVISVRPFDSLNANSPAFYQLLRQDLSGKFSLALAIEKGKH